MNRKRNHSNFLSWRLLLLGYSFVVFLLSSCDSTRRVPKGQYLLTRNTIIYPITQTGKAKGLEKEISSVTKQQLANLQIPPEINPQAVLAYVKQKPNTKILGLFPLHLFIYNTVNPEKAREKKLERDQKIVENNNERIAKGKKAKTDDQIKAKQQRKTFREWVMGVGEPPVILDSSLMTSSLKQIELFLHNKGYFNCKVRDSVSVENKKAKVFYIIRRGEPYKIDSLKYICPDSSIRKIVYADSVNCLINQGNNYDEDVFLKERDRLTYHLNDNGYYAFSKVYVHYDIDSSTAGKRLMNVAIVITRFSKQDSLHPDSTIEVPHPVYHIKRVIVQLQYDPSNTGYVANDTTRLGNYVFVYPFNNIGFSPKRLLQKIFIKQGELYRISNVDYTYTGLAQLKTFRYISVKFTDAGNNMLDCYIQLQPSVRQGIGIETVGQNTGGDLGVQGDILYENKNLFNGAETFQFKIKGGLEAQTILGSQPSQGNIGGIKSTIQLNTIDVGPEIDLAFPRTLVRLPITRNDSERIKHPRIPLWPKANPQSVFKIFYDYQKLPIDYERNIFGFAHTFNYDPYEKKDQKKWHIEYKFPEISYVHALLYPGFQQNLENTNNFFLINSFGNHLIPDIGVTVIYNNQHLIKRHHFEFLKLSVEESGALLRTVDNITEHKAWGTDTQYTIAGVPYSHYLKEEIDGRYYKPLSKDDKLVFRLYGGIGEPLAGVPQELPFDKSFWGGGANDIRGWEPRSLGPGGYGQATIVDQIGDIKLESNIEYRINVIKFFGLAAFVDAGNIWLLYPNPAVPNGNFLVTGPNAFYNQIAVSTGIGFRFDFTYFVFRFDIGIPLVDPARAGTTWKDHWAANHEASFNRSVFNIGIGYPF